MGNFYNCLNNSSLILFWSKYAVSEFTEMHGRRKVRVVWCAVNS